MKPIATVPVLFSYHLALQGGRNEHWLIPITSRRFSLIGRLVITSYSSWADPQRAKVIELMHAERARLRASAAFRCKVTRATTR